MGNLAEYGEIVEGGDEAAAMESFRRAQETVPELAGQVPQIGFIFDGACSYWYVAFPFPTSTEPT